MPLPHVETLLAELRAYRTVLPESVARALGELERCSDCSRGAGGVFHVHLHIQAIIAVDANEDESLHVAEDKSSCVLIARGSESVERVLAAVGYEVIGPQNFFEVKDPKLAN